MSGKDEMPLHLKFEKELSKVFLEAGYSFSPPAQEIIVVEEDTDITYFWWWVALGELHYDDIDALCGLLREEPEIFEEEIEDRRFRGGFRPFVGTR